MLGAVIGDIAGSLYEFNNTSDYNFRMFARGAGYTDDTICSVAVADAILRCRRGSASGDDSDFGHGPCTGRGSYVGYDPAAGKESGNGYGPAVDSGEGSGPGVEAYKASLLRWCRRYAHPMGGYGAMFNRWVFGQGARRPYGSFGNGAAMRVSPVGWAFDTEAEVIRQAMMTAEVTHNHREGLIGAAAVALAIFRLRIRSGLTKSGLPAFAFSEGDGGGGEIGTGKGNASKAGKGGVSVSAGDSGTLKDDASGADAPILSKKAINKVVEDIMKTCYGPKWRENLPPRGYFDGTCQGTVPVAFDVISRSDSFEDAIRNAVSYGGDSDTLGAIAGSIAEACWPIPSEMAATALGFLPERIKAVVLDFNSVFRK